MEDYEIHVNVQHNGDRESVEEVARKHGWKASFIEGPQDLDAGTAFLTTHTTTYAHAKVVMDLLTRDLNFQVLRRKIEHVVFDSRRGDV